MSYIPESILIPIDVFFDRDLTPISRDILALLYSDYYPKDFKITNISLSIILSCSVQTISNGIRDLIKEGYLLSNNSRGQNRQLTVNMDIYEKPITDIQNYGKPIIGIKNHGKSRR